MIKLSDAFRSVFLDNSGNGNIKLRRLNSQLEYVDPLYISPDVAEKHKDAPMDYKILYTEAVEHEGCQVTGYIDVYKMPGTLHFFLNLREQELMHAGINPREILGRITFSHKLKSVTFGNVTDQKEMLRLFGESSITDFDKVNEIPYQNDVNFCLYLFHAMPHMLSIKGEKINKETYQYPTIYHCSNSPMNIAAYQVSLAYKVNQIGIHYDKEQWSLLQLFTSISAIVAGIYVVMNTLKRGLEALF